MREFNVYTIGAVSYPSTLFFLCVLREIPATAVPGVYILDDADLKIGLQYGYWSCLQGKVLWQYLKKNVLFPMSWPYSFCAVILNIWKLESFLRAGVSWDGRLITSRLVSFQVEGWVHCHLITRNVLLEANKVERRSNIERTGITNGHITGSSFH